MLTNIKISFQLTFHESHLWTIKKMRRWYGSIIGYKNIKWMFSRFCNLNGLYNIFIAHWRVYLRHYWQKGQHALLNTFRLLLYTKHTPLTMSLKAFSMAPTTRLSCETFFSVKKRVGGVLGEPGAPAAPRSEAALVRARWDVEVRWWLIGSSPRHVGASRFGVQTISITSWRCIAMWWCRRREAITATPEPAWPSNNAQ